MLAILWTLFIVAAVWVLLIRPQRRRMLQHQALVSGLAVGHRIVTAGGIHGEVRNLDDDVVTVEIAPGTLIRLERRAVARDLDAPSPLPESSGSGDSADEAE